MLRRALTGLLLPLLLAPAASAQSPRVDHEFSFPDLNQQYVTVRSSFPASPGVTSLHIPAWIPGSYVIRDFAAGVESVRFIDEQGNERAFRKTTKDTWQVDTADSAQVVAEYRVHAGELSVNTSWVSPDYVLLNPVTFLLYNEATRQLPQRVTITPPPGLGDVLSAMTDDGAGRFLAADFDELIDSPIVIAKADVREFNVDDHPYRLVTVAGTEFWDTSQAAADVAAITAATNLFWGEVPFRRPYWIFNILADTGGGLEHDHSTVIMGHRWQMRDREDYIKWLSLVAHEYFHAWNVRRMRPRELTAYDLQSEQYSDALWLAEGFTSYYDNLLLSRAQLIGPDEYFKRLALDLHVLETTPGREQISLRGASRDAWIRHYKPVPNSINSTVSYYVKGAVLGFVLDTRLRSGSRGRLTLDDVMRRFWQRWKSEPYPETAFLKLVADMADHETREWLEERLEQPGSLDIDQALAWYGLQLNRHPVNNTARELGEPLQAGMGINWESGAHALIVSSIVHGMAASKAGVLPGDELLAISGERVTRETLDDRMSRVRPGQQVQLLLSRHNRIVELPLMLDEARPATYEVMLSPDFGERRLRRLESWLGQDLTFDP